MLCSASSMAGQNLERITSGSGWAQQCLGKVHTPALAVDATGVVFENRASPEYWHVRCSCWHLIHGLSSSHFTLAAAQAAHASETLPDREPLSLCLFAPFLPCS